MMNANVSWTLGWLIAGAALANVLGLWGGAAAAPQGGQPPFRNSVEQREEMIRELREIKLLLKEQNALLRAASAPGHVPAKP